MSESNTPVSSETRSEHDTEPLNTIRLALIWARANRITVVPSFLRHGVLKYGTEWWPDPDGEVVDVLGAVLLAMQPRDVVEVELAIATCLKRSVAWVRGFGAGVAHRELDPEEMAKLSRQEFIDGVQAGVVVRMGLIGPGAV